MKDYLECSRRQCDWTGWEDQLVDGEPYIWAGVKTTDLICPKCGNPEHVHLPLVEALVDAQKEAIWEQLNGGTYNTKEKILAYYDNCPFYGHAVKQTKYKRPTEAINRLAKKDIIIKLHKGAGEFSRYTFHKDDLAVMIDEVLVEIKDEHEPKQTA